MSGGAAAALRIGMLGGIPASLGGGGLEVQLRETAAALARRGHQVFHLAAEPEPRAFDVLHAFGAEPDVCHQLTHWRRNPAPLVVSPVIVVPPRRVVVERVAGRVPVSLWGPRARALLLQRADVTIAQTRHEAGFVHSLGARRVELVPNGVQPEPATAAPPGTPTEPYVALVGTVSARKRQRQSVAALAGHRPVVAGGFDGSGDERRAFESAVSSSGGTWLGEVSDRGALAGLVQGARAVVHLSRAEGQSLSLIEALALGTPVVVSSLPANLELAERYPEHVHLVDRFEDLAGVVARLGPRPDRAAPVPSWDDVAAAVEDVYRDVLGPPR